MDMHPTPPLEQFLLEPAEQLHGLVPRTLIYAPGGTRRHAAMLGHPTDTDEYMRWARDQTDEAVALFFQHGVRHVFVPTATSTQLSEAGKFGSSVLRWVRQGVLDYVERYVANGWRVRFVGGEDVEQLSDIDALLREKTPAASDRTLWFMFSTGPESVWQQIFRAVHDSKASGREEAVRALYGEIVPPAGIFLGSGKPSLSVELFPPLLAEKAECYWVQRPGYTLSQQEFRRIVYDYAYTRHTWRQDKTGRAEEILKIDRTQLESLPTLGLGERVGPFWFPLR